MAKFNEEKNCIEIEAADTVDPNGFSFKLSHSVVDRLDDHVRKMYKERDELIFTAFEEHGYSREWIMNPENFGRVHTDIIGDTYSTTQRFFFDDDLLFIVCTDWRQVVDNLSPHIYTVEYSIVVKNVSTPLKEMFL